MREAKPTWTRCIRRFLDTAYAPRCGLCAVLGEGGICSVCFSGFEPFPAGDEEEGRGEMSPHVRSTAIAFRYEGRASQAVQRLKYSRVTSLAEEMARLLAEAFDTSGIPQPDAFVPVPIHWTRWCARGFNQSELLCTQLNCAKVRSDLLRRVRATRSQAGLTLEERRTNLRGAFRASAEVKGASLVLVDDVRTSGATAIECARTLLEAGAIDVSLLAFSGA